MQVNDRSVSVLENYDFEVIRTQKSRNAILCETNKGWYIPVSYTHLTLPTKLEV